MIRETVTSFPLYWPPGWERTKRPTRAPFRNATVYGTTQGILREFELMGVPRFQVVISTNQRLKPDGMPYSNQRRLDDHGAAVWFVLDGEERVLACDRWDLLADNLRAIEKHIEAIRGQERWGVGTARQAFGGFVALPEAASGEPWWETLGIARDAELPSIEAAFKARAKSCHPDMPGGSREAWDRLQDALAQARAARR